MVAASGAAQDAGSPVPGLEVQALAGSADKLGPVTLRQAPGDERPRPGPAAGMPADLERAAAVRPAADRMDTHIKRAHVGYPLSHPGTPALT
jgi:hypothetical protein